MSANIAIAKRRELEAVVGSPENVAQEVVQVKSELSITKGNDGGEVTQVRSFSDLNPALLRFLYQNQSPMVDHALEFLEKKTNVKRENLAYGFVGVLSVYLIIGSLAELVCNLIGFGYPAYASVHAIRTEDKEDDTHWLTYWTVFASFSLLDFFSESLMGILPIYWLAKVAFLLYLALPQTNGAIRLYHSLVEPIVVNIEGYMSKYFDRPKAE